MSEQKIYYFRSRDDKGGLVTRSGKLIVAPKFTKREISESTLFVPSKGKNTLFDLTSEDCHAIDLSLETYSDTARVICCGLIRVVNASDDKIGFVNTKGELVIPCIYHGAGHFHDGLCAVTKGGSWGYIDTEGNEVLPFRFETANDFEDGAAVAKYDDKWHLIDRNGNDVFDVSEYEWVDDYASPLGRKIWHCARIPLSKVLRASKNGKEGLIDRQGNALTSFEFDEIFYTDDDGKYLVSVKDGHIGVFDLDGKELVPCQYDWKKPITYTTSVWERVYEVAPEFAENRGWFVEKDGLRGVVSDQKEYIPCKYERLWYLGGSLFGFYNDHSVGLIKDGSEICLGVYSNFEAISCGMLGVKKDGLYGYLNAEAQEVIPCQYEEAGRFGHDGFAVVTKGGKKGLIDKQGNYILPCEYAYIGHLCADLYNIEEDAPKAKRQVFKISKNAVIATGYDFSSGKYFFMEYTARGKYGIRNLDGKRIVPCEYDDIDQRPSILNFSIAMWRDPTKSTKFMTRKAGLYGSINDQGEVVLPAEYNEIQFCEDLILAKQGSKWLVFDAAGNLIEQPKPAKKSKK